jgi:hypothetical protein
MRGEAEGGRSIRQNQAVGPRENAANHAKLCDNTERIVETLSTGQVHPDVFLEIAVLLERGGLDCRLILNALDHLT